MTKSEKKHASKNTLALLLIALPGITYLIINNYIPIIGTFIAFKKFSYAKGIWGSPWCGLDNFKFLFLTDDAWVCVRPSGTEPKVKFYYGVKGTSLEDADEKSAVMGKAVLDMVNTMM